MVGIKLLPTSQGYCWYQPFAFSSDQRCASASTWVENARIRMMTTELDRFKANSREKLLTQRSSFKLDFSVRPGWRNWQTQRTQNPPVLSTLGVQLPLPAPTRKSRVRHGLLAHLVARAGS